MPDQTRLLLFQWIVIGFGLGLALVFLRRSGEFRPTLRRWLWAAALLFAGGAVVFAWRQEQWQRRQAEFFASLPRQGRPDGYRSSQACYACHPRQYVTWHDSYHRTMTQFASAKSVLGNFQNVTLPIQGQVYRLEQRGQEFWVNLEDPDPGALLGADGRPARVWRRVGLLTGSHHMQAYWIPSRNPNRLILLPFAYLRETGGWVPFVNTFLRDPKIGPFRQTWNLNCINCHTTAGQPRLDPETGLLDTRAAELGIACEACHGPGAEHIQANQNPWRRYWRHFTRRADPTIVNPARCSPHRSSQICGQCHGIKWIRDRMDWVRSGFRYRPGQDLDATDPLVRPAHLQSQPWLDAPLRSNPLFLEEHYWPDGIVRVSGRDFNGLAESPCYQRGNLSCLSCHSLHESRPANQLAAGMESNEACLQCHRSFRGKIEAHTHHRAGSSGSICYNCHMPYTVYGLLKAIRSHRIDSPNLPTTLATGRPDACDLCHLDRTLAWTARYLKTWYGQKPPPLAPDQQSVSAAALWLLRGDAGQRALLAWHLGWKPAKEAAGEFWIAPYLAQLLDDPYSAVRYIAARSLRELPRFGNFQFDFVSGPEELARARSRALEQWKLQPGLGKGTQPLPNLLIGAGGKLDEAQVARFLKERDNRSMDLQE